MEQKNLKDIVVARFQNPKFIYDGKRMRNLATRKMVDYSSSLIYDKFYSREIPVQTNSKFDVKDFLIHLKSPEKCHNDLSLALNTKFAHISINKIKCPVNTLKWTPDGRRCISGTSTGEFTLWNGFSFNFETILQAHESAVRSLCWSPSGSFLISADTLGIIKYWHPSMNNIQIVQGHTEAIRDLSFAHCDAKFCSASDDGKIKIWDSKDSKEEAALTGHGWDVRVAQWHKTKSLIASGGKDNLVKLWDPRYKNELSTLHIHKNTILTLKWSLNGNYLLTGGKDQMIKMVDIRTMKEVCTYKSHKKEITTLVVHPMIENMFVSGGAEGGLYFWQMFNEQPLEIIENAHENTIWCLDYHPIGHVLTSGSVDQSCRFWIRPRPGESQNKEETENLEVENEGSSEVEDEKIPGL